MAQRSFAVLVVLAGILVPAMCQYSASYNIQNNLQVPVNVHCHDTATPDERGVVTVQPGAGYSYAFEPDSSYENEAYHCDFQQGTQTQNFNVWQTDDGSSNPVVGVSYTKWNVQADGFYFRESPDNNYYKLYGWN